ncbi:MAG TPA: hypothetical protein VEI01_24895 [Terriglobales bacterium]|nr:hypothetical protein [Terriglobales bacterium]
MNRGRALKVLLVLAGLIFVISDSPLIVFLWPGGGDASRIIRNTTTSCNWQGNESRGVINGRA